MKTLGIAEPKARLSACMDRNEALHRLRGLFEDADVVAPTTRVRGRAEPLLTAHALRAGDALPLAAALVWCEESPAGR